MSARGRRSRRFWTAVSRSLTCGPVWRTSPAVGFATAVELVTPEETERLKKMRDRLLERLLNEVPHTRLNGHPVHRLPHNANVSFRFVEGESLLLHLDMRGFAVSTGSACFSRSLEASHVILGIGGDHERAHGPRPLHLRPL